MKRVALIYLSTLIVFLPLDILFLSLVGKKLFAEHVGDMILTTPRMAPAVLFYVLFLAGIVLFVNGAGPADWTHNVLYGAMFGLICYATFELTNMSVLKHWEWTVVISDIVWGAFVTAIGASVGGLLADWTLRRM